MIIKRKISPRSGERGFTLLETLLVVGLTTMIAVGIVAAFIEGLDTLHTITDTQAVEFGHQRAMHLFISDVQSATWFFNGTVHEEDGTVILRETANPNFLLLGYPGPDGENIWVRYKIRYGSFTRGNYLMRTVITSSGADDGTSILSSGLANLQFDYYNEDGEFTDQIPDIRKIVMTLSVSIGGSTTQREYESTLRSVNMGVKDPIGDFDDVETEFFNK